jgi:sugar diacid utilization regulator
MFRLKCKPSSGVIVYNNTKRKLLLPYAQHILETGHTYGTIENTLHILHREKEGPLMNTLEQFHIHNLQKTIYN